jgi:hypothetical protein
MMMMIMMIKNKKNDASNALATNYKMSVKEVKNKFKSLRYYLAKEHKKVTEKRSGAGADDVYDSPWFAYKSLVFILTPQSPKTYKSSFLTYVYSS